MNSLIVDYPISNSSFAHTKFITKPMPIIKTIQGKSPQISPSSWIAENAVLTGDVLVGEGCSIWFNVVIRGDVNQIRIGNRSNIQDGAVVHGTHGKQDTVIGEGVTVGHQAIVHGCVLKDNCLVGMGATVLDDAVVESEAVVAAGAVVTMGTVVKSGWIYAGVPAKPVKELTAEAIQKIIYEGAKHYVEYKEWYR